MAIADISDRSIEQLVGLTGKVAVITGGARGIGAAVAERYAEAGAHVILADFNVEAAAEAAAKLRSKKRKADPARLDVTNEKDVIRCFDAVVKDHGSLDILVNNAGIYPSKSILETTCAEWDEVQNINLRGVFIASREAGKRMVAAARGGVIVNISALAGLAIVPGIAAHYAVSKAGVVMLTQALASELGKYNIRVLSLAPGLVLTQTIKEHPDLKHFDAKISPTLPLGRAALPDDVARAALFCASGLAGAMTGDTFRVDCGQYLT